MIEKSCPRVSVIVPCFNNGLTIRETIESVRSQTISDWELICVDDGSSDSTVNVIKKYAEADNRIKLLIRDKDPKGGSHCRNIGAASALGEYLIFLDGDDLLSPTCIENRLEKIENSNYDFVVFPMGFFKGASPQNNIFAGTRLDERIDYLYYYASGNPGWTITSPIIRKSFFLSLGGFNVNFPRLQDVEYNFRAIWASEGNYKIEYEAEYDCFYRYGNESSSTLPSKLKRALAAYHEFLILVLSYMESGRIPHQRKISRAIFNTYCNGYIMYSSLLRFGEDIEYPSWLNLEESDKSQFLFRHERNKLNLLYITRKMPIVNFYMARIMSKLVRKSFVN